MARAASIAINSVAKLLEIKSSSTKKVVWLSKASFCLARPLFDVTGDPDTASVPPTGKFDLQNIDTHEFGHFVGLNHVEEIEHTEYKFSSTDEVKKRSLECGDVKGVQKNYGAA